MSRLIGFCCCLLPVMVCSTGLSAQNALPIGQWRSHLPYRVGAWVTQSPETVYYATEWSVAAIDKAEESVSFLTTVEGLSNTGIERISYNEGGKTLLVVYRNSVIDLVKPDRIATLNQIRNFRNFTGEKLIRHVHVANDSIVYLAANYGISKLNISAEEFVFSTFTGIDIQHVVEFKGQIYMATPEGIYTIEADNPNPEDFSRWRLLGPSEGFPGDYSSRSMAVFNDQLYADVSDSLYRFDGSSNAAFVLHEPGQRIQYLSSERKNLLIGLRCFDGSKCFSSKLLYLTPAGQLQTASPACLGDLRYALEDEQGRIWLADGFRQFRRLSSLSATSCDLRVFNSPFSESNRELFIANNQLWLATGAVDQRFNNRFLDHGFASFADGQWTIYNRENVSAMRGEDLNSPNDDLLDIISIAVHPENGKIYAASYFEGLLEFDGTESRFFNEKNSSLGNAVGDGSRTRVSGLRFDEDNNLWVSNFLAERPLSVLKADGSWQNFTLCGQTQVHQLDIDDNGFIWLVVAGTQAGLVVLDPGDLANIQDDRCRVLTSSNTSLPTNATNCVAVDLEGDVWVGTSEGVIIFECGSNVFDPSCLGSRRVIQNDNFNSYLLESEDIQAIAVDGANRKWVGTRNGVFLLSPSGEEQIARFTVDNSPLFDNVITDIAVNQQTGEVFIGTSRGVISYQGDAVEGSRFQLDNVMVFPNPVRPEYEGPIAIRGLASDANVKITDINGKLVFETQALGGQAIWDGRDYSGRRANSGVYLVFSTSNPRDVGFTAKPTAAIARIVLLN